MNFIEQVKPILEQHCLRCHGPEKEEGALRVDTEDGLLDKYFVTKGDADESLFHQVLLSDDEDKVMPPTDEPRMTTEEISVIKDWIDQGADWPENVPAFVEPAGDASDDEAQEDTPDGDNKVESAENSEVDDEKSEKKTEDNFWILLWENCGVLHPAIIHFPIALLIGGAFFAVFGFRGDSPMGDAAYYCLWLAALSGIVSCVVGWSYASPGMHPNGASWNDFEFSKTIVQHRWGGILVTVLSLIFAVIASSTRRRDPYANGGLWKFGLILTAALCGYVGHLGGDMTHNGEVEKALEKLGLVNKEEPVKTDDDNPSETQELTDDDAKDGSGLPSNSDAENEDGSADDGNSAEQAVDDENADEENADDENGSDDDNDG